VARYVFLDSGPLGLASNARGKPDPDHCRNWLLGLEVAGVRVVIPEIADYEVRRELIRIGATAGIRRLDRLLARFPLLTVDRPAVLRAAELWADVRRAGLPTADPLSLDGDAILAGQVLTAISDPDVAIVATRNVGHLGRFPGIDAQLWNTIN
jgi:predicted nucleic acid-binding protein